MPVRHKSVRASRRKRPPLPVMGCGVDVVELTRFRQALQRGGEAFLQRVFTKGEAAYARARRRTMFLHLAGRFAAKEAVMKAVSQIDPTRTLAMNQIEIRNDRIGRPRIVLHDRLACATPGRKRVGAAGRPAKRLTIHVSLSHVDTVAVASAIAIR